MAEEQPRNTYPAEHCRLFAEYTPTMYGLCTHSPPEVYRAVDRSDPNLPRM